MFVGHEGCLPALLNEKNITNLPYDTILKITLDKKFGAAWHVCIGEGFGFDITYQAKNMVYVYYGQIGVVAYKC